jgi:hypothetical protein
MSTIEDADMIRILTAPLVTRCDPSRSGRRRAKADSNRWPPIRGDERPPLSYLAARLNSASCASSSFIFFSALLVIVPCRELVTTR